MYEMTMNSGEVVSVSAVTKAQVTNAEILFGKNAKVLIKRIDELVKIKELDTSKLEAVLDILRDTEATTAFAKKAAGKNAVTAIKNLYKAKTLVATVNGLRAIKIKVTAPNAATKVDVKPKPVAKTKGDIGIKPAKVTATRVNQNAELPKVNLARITPAFMKTISQAQTDAIADQLTKATGLKFLPIYQETNGQSSPWIFEAHNPKAGYKSVSIDPPYAFHSQMRSIKWAVSAVDSKGGIYVGNELKSPTAAALAKAVKDVIGKVPAKGKKPKEGYVGPKLKVSYGQPAKFRSEYSVLRRLTGKVYGPDFIKAVIPEAGPNAMYKSGRSTFRFKYKDLDVAVSMLQKGWAMVFTGPHIEAPRTVQIHLGELESIRNVINLFVKKDATAAQVNLAIKKGLRDL